MKSRKFIDKIYAGPPNAVAAANQRRSARAHGTASLSARRPQPRAACTQIRGNSTLRYHSKDDKNRPRGLRFTKITQKSPRWASFHGELKRILNLTRENFLFTKTLHASAIEKFEKSYSNAHKMRTLLRRELTHTHDTNRQGNRETRA